MELNKFVEKFEKVKDRKGYYSTRCPSHNDQNNSLSIRVRNEKIQLKCFTGCSVDSILSAVGLQIKDLYIEPFSQNGKAQKKIVETYDYCDEKGDLLYQNVRYSPKGFVQRRPNGQGGFDYNLNDVRRVPYRLRELIEANTEGKDIFLCEGEKDADNLRKLGFTASSFKNWKPEFNPYIKDCRVYLIQDHDQAGFAFAENACQLLSGNVRSLKIIDLFADEILPEKHGKDVSDYISSCKREEDLSDVEIAERLSVFADNASYWQPQSETPILTEEETKFKSFPEPSERCFYGLAGEVTQLLINCTEAHIMALLLQFFVYFGNVIGRNPYFQVEGDKHHTNLFCVLVGDTANGRKGTSLGRIKEVFKGLDEDYERNSIVSGLASGEGLLYQVRDAIGKTKNGESKVVEDLGVQDKRLLLTEGEFAQVLRVQGREGNTLSTVLRNLWDTGTARNLTKNSPLKTTDAHVSIIGHITKAELIGSLKNVETANGYANRILWCCVRRSKYLPFGAELDENKINALKIRLKEKIDFAKNIRKMEFSEEAKFIWKNVYTKLESSRFGFLGKVTQRASPYVLRLSCLYALLDGQSTISRQHLEAGLAVW
ncbi:MAG: DUF3987 domain-containing protein, partial [Candidatus Caenarcaniphilales bacterium]|nr:DUF3987 domain-containing protein [Candidatus Caenarcaniphilales bacterium]